MASGSANPPLTQCSKVGRLLKKAKAGAATAKIPRTTRMVGWFPWVATCP